MDGRQMQKYILDYLAQCPNQQSEALSLEDNESSFLSYLKKVGVYTPATTPKEYKSLTNTLNPSANTLLRRGVVEHLRGTRGWKIRPLSQEAQAVLSMSSTEKRKLVRERWSATPQGRNLLEDIINFEKLHEDSPFFNREMQFPDGTADGLLTGRACTWLAQESHIIDKYITTAIGRKSWDKSPNVMLEHAVVNLAKYYDAVSTDIVPGGLVYREREGEELGLNGSLDGKMLRVLPEYLPAYRAAFLLRKRLVAMMESDTLLKEVVDTLKRIEESDPGESETE